MSANRCVIWCCALVVLFCAGTPAAHAQVGPARVAFTKPPSIGARAGEISLLVNYQDAPGIARIEVTIFTSVTFGWFAVPVPVGTDSADATLPKGAWGTNIAGIPSNWLITHAAVVLKDKRGKVIGRKVIGGVAVQVP